MKKIVNFEQQQKVLTCADKLYTQAHEIHQIFISQLKNGQNPNLDTLHNLSQQIVDSVFDNSDALACLVMLKESNNCIVEHALNCSILLSLFAKFKGCSPADTVNLSLSGLLMDSGMALLPNQLSMRTSTFDEADHAIIRTHVDIGYEIAENFSDLAPMVLDVIANHHERLDGSGYPLGKSTEQISLHAQMAAIADVFDSLLTDCSDRSSTSAQIGLETLQKDPGHNAELVNEFIQAIGLFPVGSLVHLKSGDLAIVVRRNRLYPLKPSVITFYNIKEKQHTEMKHLDLNRHSSDKIIASVTPEEFDINLPKFFRGALLAN